MLRVNSPLILPSTANSKIFRLRTRLVSGFAISSTTASVVFSVHWIASILKFKIVQFFQNYSSVFSYIFHNLTVASNSILNTNMTFDVSISNEGLVAVENSLPLISITRFGEPTGPNWTDDYGVVVCVCTCPCCQNTRAISQRAAVTDVWRLKIPSS